MVYVNTMKIVLLFVFLNLAIIKESHAQKITCGVGEYLVTGHFRRAYIKADGTSVKATNVVTHCKKLTSGYDFNKIIKDGLPTEWPHKSEKTQKWTPEEINRLIEAIEGLPDYLKSIYINGIYRLQKSKDFPNPATNSNKAEIALYDEAFSKNRNLSRIVAHELAHQLYGKMTEDEKLDYRMAAGWHTEVESGKVYWLPRVTGYIEPDGIESAEEDYANNLEHFVHNSDKLKEISPKIYNWFYKKYPNKTKGRN